MGFCFTFRQLEGDADVRGLVDFVAAQDLGYPNYDAWVQRTEAELFAEQKNAVMAFSEGRLVGDAVYQDHKGLSGVVEIKNMRVHPRLRFRNFGRFMLRQIEVEARRQRKQGIILDTRADQSSTIRFLESCRYKPILEGPLYDPNQLDITFMKPLRTIQKQRILIIGKDYIEQKLL